MENQKQEELVFSNKALEELSKIDDPKLKKYLDIILQTFREKDAIAASVMARGSGDSGTIENVDITYKDKNLENGRLVYLVDESPIHQALYEICDLIAEEVVPGYEINDGGGFEIEFTRNRDVIDVAMVGFHNVCQEETAYEFDSTTGDESSESVQSTYYICSIVEHVCGYEFTSKFLLELKANEDLTDRLRKIQVEFRGGEYEEGGQDLSSYLDGEILIDFPNTEEISKECFDSFKPYLACL